jgi:hypothetical protein
LRWILACAWVASIAAAVIFGRNLAHPTLGQIVPEKNVASRLADALSDRDLLTRTYELVASLRQLDEGNIDAARSVLEAQRIGVTAFEARLFMFAWSRIDPAGAFEWANSWPGRWRSTLANAALFAWGFRDPGGAVRALETLEGPERAELHPSLIAGWARSGDTAGLSDYLFSRPASRERSQFIGVLFDELILLEHGREAIRNWAESIPVDAPNQGKAAAFLTAGGALAQNDPKDAVALYESHQMYEYAQPALRAIARRWVEFHDPRDLFAWLVTLPEGQSRNDAVDAGFSRWWANHPQAAASWLRESSLNAALDPAVSIFAIETSRVSEARAIVWADRIKDPVMRRRTIAPILRRWVARNRMAARAWMKEQSLSAELQREFLKP